MQGQCSCSLEKEHLVLQQCRNDLKRSPGAHSQEPQDITQNMCIFVWPTSSCGKLCKTNAFVSRIPMERVVKTLMLYIFL